MSTHNMCFHGEIRKILMRILLLFGTVINVLLATGSNVILRV